MNLPFFKYHALGNDYIVMDPAKLPRSFRPSPKVVQQICRRNFGLGSDGILYGPLRQNGGMGIRIFNPDGSEAEKSGNGVRIFARYLLDAGYVQKRLPFTMQTLGGEVVVEFVGNLIRVDMGKAIFASQKIPVKGRQREIIKEPVTFNGDRYLMTCVSMGNPHCVLLAKKISGVLARNLGPVVENHRMFPNKINLQLLKVLDRKNIQIEIWERGAGYTLASGSSSCAAASAALKMGLIDQKVSVHMPGGKLAIETMANAHVMMTGPVVKVAEGVLFIER